MHACSMHGAKKGLELACMNVTHMLQVVQGKIQFEFSPGLKKCVHHHFESFESSSSLSVVCSPFGPRFATLSQFNLTFCEFAHFLFFVRVVSMAMLLICFLIVCMNFSRIETAHAVVAVASLRHVALLL